MKVHSPEPISSALTRRATVTLMFAMALASAVGLVAWGPVGLVSHMHHFADARSFSGTPNAVNVLTHLPLIPFGLWGLWRVSLLPASESLRWAWGWFFVCQMLATIGGMVYHWAPNDVTFIWDQVPKSAASTLFAFAFLGECIDRRCAQSSAIAMAMILSLLGGCWWLYTLTLDHVGDLRPLMWLEMLPAVSVAAGAWSLTGHLLTRHDWLRSQISFVLAQVLDFLDKPIFEWSNGSVSGHSLRHLALAACVGWVAYRLGGNALGNGSRWKLSREEKEAQQPTPTTTMGELVS